MHVFFFHLTLCCNVVSDQTNTSLLNVFKVLKFISTNLFFFYDLEIMKAIYHNFFLTKKKKKAVIDIRRHQSESGMIFRDSIKNSHHLIFQFCSWVWQQWRSHSWPECCRPSCSRCPPYRSLRGYKPSQVGLRSPLYLQCWHRHTLWMNTQLQGQQ